MEQFLVSKFIENYSQNKQRPSRFSPAFVDVVVSLPRSLLQRTSDERENDVCTPVSTVLLLPLLLLLLKLLLFLCTQNMGSPFKEIVTLICTFGHWCRLILRS